LVKERPYGDPLHRCSLSLTAVPLCPAGEALVTLAKQTSCKPLADPAAARISEHLRFCSLNFAALPRNIRPAKVRLGRSATSLRMTQRGRLARCVCVAGRQGAAPCRGCCQRRVTQRGILHAYGTQGTEHRALHTHCTTCKIF